MSEHGEQRAVVDWCFLNQGKWPELDLIFAIPNGAMLGGGQIGAIRMRALKEEGLRPGVSDLFLPCARGGYFGLFMEMKTEKGVVSENQKEFMAGVEIMGYRTAVCYGAEEAIDILTDYLLCEKTEVQHERQDTKL